MRFGLCMLLLLVAACAMASEKTVLYEHFTSRY